MKNNFIPKLETEKFLIGSFDAYQDEAKNLAMANSNLTEEQAANILKGMPTTYRAAILNKEGEYIGYIGLFDVNGRNDTGSIRFEVNQELSDEEIEEVLNEFKNYAHESLHIDEVNEMHYITRNDSRIEKEKNELVPNGNIVLANNLLFPGIKAEDKEKFSQEYSIPLPQIDRLQFAYSIKAGDKTIGIIGLSNLIWSNKRANLCLLLDKSLGSDIIDELPGYLIDDYIALVHDASVHNITLSVSGSNKDMLEILNNTKMGYYGTIPYGAKTGNDVESNYMFQHIPNMKKENGLYLPDNKIISTSSLETGKKELSEVIDLENGYKLVRPSAFEKLGIDFNTVLQGHIKAMQNRNDFTIPLGEDKYFLQQGNEKYGIYKAVNNYSYLLLNENNEYAGYINELRRNADGKNVEVEIGINPSLQHRGLGTLVIKSFYDELFSTGVASVTSSVFSFNDPSIKLHEKVAQLNGVRLESYYVNGKLWDMNIYSKVNDTIGEKGNIK